MENIRRLRETVEHKAREIQDLLDGIVKLENIYHEDNNIVLADLARTTKLYLQKALHELKTATVCLI